MKPAKPNPQSAIRNPKSEAGSASISPHAPVMAGSWGTWTITYKVPPGGIDDGGSIRVAIRFASDWAIPQMNDPSGDHYLTVSCSRSETQLVSSWRARAHIRPYQPHLFIEVLDAPLESGDEITIVYGDCSHGGRGTRAQTFVQDKFDFQIVVDSLGTGVYDSLTENPHLKIVSNEPHHLVALATGDGSTIHPARLLVRGEDIWGNAIKESIAGTVSLKTSGPENNLPEKIELNEGSHLFPNVSCQSDGVLRISVEHPLLGSAEVGSLVINRACKLHRFWGDLHGQSGETVGTNTAEQYFHYARDMALCDFAGHQGNDFQITDALWEEINRLARDLTREGAFIVFPGYEWSGLTPVGGDRNVLFLDEGQTIRRSSTVLVKGQSEQLVGTPLRELYEEIKKSDKECILIPHIGGRRANLEYFDPELEPVVEVHSCWGTFEWFYHDALRRGYRVGVVANSDGHKGRPGAEHAGTGKFGVFGGLTCILAENFDRASLFYALKSRHCYGTSGPRIALHAEMEGKSMGSDLSLNSESLSFSVNVIGTAPIESIDLLKAGQCIDSWEGCPYEERSGDLIRIRWTGARILNRNRATDWNGSLKIIENQLLSVDGFAFDSPSEGIQEWNAEGVRWKSITTGDEDGLILNLEKAGVGSINYDTGPVSCQIAVDELKKGPVVKDAGGVGQEVVFELAPPNEGLSREVTWQSQVSPREIEAIDGVIPLHLRVLQVDGHRAWTSPWFIQL